MLYVLTFMAGTIAGYGIACLLVAASRNSDNLYEDDIRIE